jgi:hypothetical protein
MVLALLIAFGLGFVVGIQYSHTLPELTPQASSTDAEHPIAGSNEDESYWYKIGKPDVLPVWLAMLFTGVVGGIALRTLGTIRAQTDALRRQNDMIVSKERARLRVDLIDLPKEPDDFPALVIKAVVTISGSTEAAVRKTAFQSTRKPTDIEANFPPTMHGMRGVPSVIRTLDSPTQVTDFVVPVGGFDDIFSGTSLVYAKGAIHYTDIFDGKWVYRFYRRYEFLFYEGGRVLGGGWKNCGNETDNGEYPDD